MPCFPVKRGQQFLDAPAQRHRLRPLPGLVRRIPRRAERAGFPAKGLAGAGGDVEPVAPHPEPQPDSFLARRRQNPRCARHRLCRGKRRDIPQLERGQTAQGPLHRRGDARLRVAGAPGRHHRGRWPGTGSRHAAPHYPGPAARADAGPCHRRRPGGHQRRARRHRPPRARQPLLPGPQRWAGRTTRRAGCRSRNGRSRCAPAGAACSSSTTRPRAASSAAPASARTCWTPCCG